MSTLFTYCAQGQTATLRVDAAELMEMAGHLHSCVCVSRVESAAAVEADLVWKATGGGEFGIDLFGAAWGGPIGIEMMFFQSENLITQVFSERHKDSLQLHAGAVVSPEGRGFLIVGESGAGKTSTTLGLMARGWKWLTDEMVLVGSDDFGLIRGVPRNFNIKEVSFGYFPETAGLPHGIEILSLWRRSLVRFVDPSVAPSGGFAPNARIEGILFPQFLKDLPEPELRPCFGTEISARLLGSISRWQDWGMSWILQTVATIPAWELRYGEPRSAALLVASRIEEQVVSMAAPNEPARF